VIIVPIVVLPLTPLSKGYTREEGRYYGFSADQDVKALLNVEKARLLFTEHQIRVAYERWVREGKPEFVDEVDKLKAKLRVKQTIIRDLETENLMLRSRLSSLENRSLKRRIRQWLSRVKGSLTASSKARQGQC